MQQRRNFAAVALHKRYASMASRVRRLAAALQALAPCAGVAAFAVGAAATAHAAAIGAAAPRPSPPGELEAVDAVGGHGGMYAGKGLLYKPADGRRGESELRFYAAAFPAAAARGDAAAEAAGAAGAAAVAASHAAAAAAASAEVTTLHAPPVHGTTRLSSALAAMAAEASAGHGAAGAAAGAAGGVAPLPGALPTFYDATLPPPARFMPRFYGVTHLADPRTGGSAPFLVLQDLTVGMARPCLLDIKMGVQTWGEDAPPAKVAQERGKWPPQAALGYRYTGMRVWEPHAAAEAGARGAGRWVVRDRAYGYALSLPAAARGLEAFLWDGARVRTELIPPLIGRLREIRSWFEVQGAHRFYGSSLLFLYDGGVEGAAGAATVDVRMIDFPHVWPIRDGGRDAGYLLGLDTLIAQLEALQAREEAVEATAALASF